MTASNSVAATRVRIAPGTGTLIRRPTAVLFVDGDDAALIDAFVGAVDAGRSDGVIDAVTDAVTDGEFGARPFVLMTWDEQLHLVVFGAIEVRTDHPSLPMLSGAGSGTWVERRLRPAGTTTIAAGAPADPSSDLQLGRIAADGFAATFEPSTAASDSSRSTADLGSAGSAPDATRSEPTVPSPGPHSSPEAAPETASEVEPETAPSGVTAQRVHSGSGPEGTRSDPTGPIGGDRLAALRAAMRAHEVEPPTVAAAVGSDASHEAPVETPLDDEVTLAPFDRPPLADPGSAARDAPTPDTSKPDTPPSDARTPDGTDDDAAPFVLAVRCGRGHVNPIHVTVCQTCGDLLEIGAQTETIRQPPLAMLELPSGESIAIDRSLVLGRRPDSDAAQAQDRAITVIAGDEPSISRTHLRIDVEDWSLTVTDCGSRSGTAIVIRPGEQPRILEPWMTHELPVGARLFLGGPTSVVIRPIPAGRSRSGG